MKEEAMQRRGWIVATVFFALDGLLVWLFRSAIPLRDLVVWATLLVIARILVNWDWTGYPQLKSIDEFHKRARFLEEIVLFGTILIPWIMIGLGIHNASYVLTPHLFVLQAHIAGEGIVEAGKGNNDWLMFLYTCVANAYRMVPLTTWAYRLHQVLFDNREEEAADWSLGNVVLVLLAGYAILVWIYWSFWYIPFVWYPFLEKAKMTKSAKQK